MSTTATFTAVERLAAVHPHHVERITREAAALAVGTPVVTLRGEFYCGLLNGDVVIVSGRVHGLAVQSVERGAHLHVRGPETLVSIPVADWTYEQVVAGQAAAETYAKGLLERAYTAANRLLGAPGTDDDALEALREAHEVRLYAFALAVLASYLLDRRL